MVEGSGGPNPYDGRWLAGFASDYHLRRLSARCALPDGPVSEHRQAAVLMADLSGFTPLGVDFEQQSRLGSERLSNVLNATFGQLIHEIHQRGGDVTAFAGDAVLAVFLADLHGSERAAVESAVACGLRCQQAVRGLQPVEGEHPDITIAIGAGRTTFIELGGYRDRWTFFSAGPSFDDLSGAAAAVLPQEILLGSRALALIGEDSVDVERRHDVGVVTALRTDPPAIAVDQMPFDPVAAALLRHYLPRNILAHDRPGVTAWMGEYRQLTTLFINLLDIDISTNRGLLEFQTAVTTVQQVLARFDCELHAVAVQEKGPVMIAAWGLPPFAHEDDAARAAQASIEIHKALTEVRVQAGVGLTTGRAFCGIHGGPTRRTYSIIGTCVNLAARLMAYGGADVLCDRPTVYAARHRVRFSPLPAVKVKGIAEPIDVFRPLWEERSTEQRLSLVTRQLEQPILGREFELATLHGLLDRLVGGGGGLVMIEGEAGIGKSTLVASMVGQSRSIGVQALVGAGDVLDHAGPYHAWRPIVEQLLDLGDAVTRSERVERVQARMDRCELGDVTPLLSPILDLRMDDNDVTSNLSGEARSDATVSTLRQLVAQAAEEQPLLIVVDDAQWVDSGSWEAVRAVAQLDLPVLLVLAQRTGPSPSGDVYAELRRHKNGVVLTVGPINHSYLEPFLASKLGVRAVPERMVEFVGARSGGHPFFIEELGRALVERGLVEIVGHDHCSLAEGFDHKTASVVPDTVHGVVAGRVDQLPPDVGLTLRVASTLGPNIDLEILGRIHPESPEPEALKDSVDELCRLDFLSPAGAGTRYTFRHAIVREAAYDTLSAEARRSLNRSIAEIYETRLPASEPSTILPLLIHHWQEADDLGRAARHMEAATNHALDIGADAEARGYAEELIQLGESGRLDDVDDQRRAMWHGQLGRSLTGLGELEAAEVHHLRTLQLVKARMPRTRVGKLVRLTFEVLVQLAHLVRSPRNRDPDRGANRRRAEAAQVYSLLAEAAYYKPDPLEFTLASLISVNYAERSGQPVSAGLGYASLGFLAGSLRLHRLATRYFSVGRAHEQDALDRSGPPPRPRNSAGHKVQVPTAHASYLLTIGRWEEAMRVLDEGLSDSYRVRDPYSAEICLSIRSITLSFLGRYDEALSDQLALYESARDRFNGQHATWGLCLSAASELALDRGEAAKRHLAAAALESGPDPLTPPMIDSARARMLARSGSLEDAIRAMLCALDAIPTTPMFVHILALTNVLEATLEFGPAEDPGVDDRVRAVQKRAVRKLRQVALAVPVGRPRSLLYRGARQAALGRKRRARRLLERSARHAERYGMLWDEGRALHLLATTGLATDVDEAAARADSCYDQLMSSSYDRRRLEEDAVLSAGKTLPVQQLAADR